jgi:hypothetical protein
VGRTLWPTPAKAEADGRVQGRIGSRSSPLVFGQSLKKKKRIFFSIFSNFYCTGIFKSPFITWIITIAHLLLRKFIQEPLNSFI